MNTLQRRRSMSHAAAAFTDETADKIPGQRLASHAPPPPPQRATTAFCRHCSRQIGDFYNSWYRVTGSYYAPALLGSYSFSLKRSAKPKAASKGTDLEDWYVSITLALISPFQRPRCRTISHLGPPPSSPAYASRYMICVFRYS